MNAKVITFYSFKGGVGRTQALANVAVGLANRGRNIVAVDMDLESPGLHAFFYPQDRLAPFKDADFADKPGLIDFVEDCLRLPAAEPKIRDLLVPCTHPNHKPGMGSIQLFTAGRLSEDYPARVGAFSWDRFYSQADGYRFMELLRDRLMRSGADYVLIDSRTGMTDVANICTFQLPDVVVVLFALHEQGIEGARRVAQAIKQAQAQEVTEARARDVLLLPSRVEEGGNLVVRDEWLLRVRNRLSDSGRLIAEQEQRLPYAAEAAYGETVVVDSPTPSKLSLAYERLIDILAPTPGAVRTSSIPAPARLSFRDLQARVDRLTQNVHALSAKLDATALTQIPFVHLQVFAQDVVQQRNGFLEEVRKIRDALRALAIESDTEIDDATEVEVDSPDTPSDWGAIVDHVQRAVRAQMDRWIAAQRRRVTEQLLAVADQDDALIMPALGELLPWIERGDLEEVEARLPTIRDDVARNGLDALLCADKLDKGRLERSRPGPEARRAWLDERLQKLLAEGSFEQGVAPMLRNLLRLRAEMSDKPSPLHWSAYNVLCGRVSDDPSEASHLFEAIGHWLWGAMWHEALTGATASEGMRSRAEPEARRQMESLLRAGPDMTAPLVRQVASGLQGLWRDGKRRLAQEIIKGRREDAVLRAALAQIGQTQTGTPPRARRELLASWLRAADPAAADALIVKGYAEALVEEGHDAEAFYAIEAFRMLGSSVGTDTGLVDLAFLLRAVERSHEELIQTVLADKEVRDRIASLRSGRAFFVLLAWQPGRLPERARAMRYQIQQSLTDTAPLAPALPPELSVLAHEAIDFDLRAVAPVRRLVGTIRDEFQANRFRGNWVASIHYETDFHAFIGDRLDALLRSEESQAAEIARQEGAWDAEKWIADSFEEQRKRGLRTSDPDGDARRTIIRTFSEARDRFLDLARRRSASGEPTLSEMLAQEPLITHEAQMLREWTLAEAPETAAEAHVAQRVARLLAATEEEDA